MLAIQSGAKHSHTGEARQGASIAAVRLLDMPNSDEILKSQNPHSKGVEPTEADSTAVRALVRRIGEKAAAIHLRCDGYTLARIAARFSVREATLCLVRQRLAVEHSAPEQGNLFAGSKAA